MKKHMISLLSFESKHIPTFFPFHDKTCLNCSTNQKHADLLEVFGAVRGISSCSAWRNVAVKCWRLTSASLQQVHAEQIALISSVMWGQ